MNPDEAFTAGRGYLKEEGLFACKQPLIHSTTRLVRETFSDCGEHRFLL
jgi:hypothetical protein